MTIRIYTKAVLMLDYFQRISVKKLKCNLIFTEKNCNEVETRGW